MSHLIAPSILSADFSNLAKEIKIINKSMAQWVHIDVMDGVFVPNISFGFPVIKSLRKLTNKIFDVHLMIIEPGKFINEFHKCGADNISVHYETCPHLHRVIWQIKEKGMKAGVAINPHLPVTLLYDIISDIDFVNLMSVNPGFGGQSFINNTYKRIEYLKNLIEKQNSKALIEIDGGVNEMNARKLIDCGADILVAGNYVFNSDNPLERINKLFNIVN